MIAKPVTSQEKLNEYRKHHPEAQPTIYNKTERQLYIGNLPPGIKSPDLVGLLNNAMRTLKLNASDDDPVLSAWISVDGHYAFVEFRSAQDASNGFGLSQVSVHGYPIKVGRPRIANSSYTSGAN